MTKKPVKLTKERALREAIRRLALKVLREEEEKTAEETPEEETPEADPTTATTAPTADPAAKEEPQEEPAPEEAPEEEGLGGDFQTAVDMFARKISLSQDTPTNDDLVDMLSQVAEKFTTTSEERLNLLKGIRNNIVH